MYVWFDKGERDDDDSAWHTRFQERNEMKKDQEWNCIDQSKVNNVDSLSSVSMTIE